MKTNEAEEFYSRQFTFFKDAVDLETVHSELAQEIMEQVARPFTSILELGAGNGLLARSLASHGKLVTTVELVPEMVSFARRFGTPGVTSLCGSFYDIHLTEMFDVLLYIDGFGVGTDEEQLCLLNRIRSWLKEDGTGLIDIYQPAYWKRVSGRRMMPFPDSPITRVYGYEHRLNRMTDTWWEEADPDNSFTQSLACYTPEAITELSRKAGLVITALYPGGAMDFDKWQYQEVVPLDECLSYRIKVKKA